MLLALIVSRRDSLLKEDRFLSKRSAEPLEKWCNCRVQQKPLLMAAHFAYALQGEKRSESARQAARFVTARIAGVPNAGQCGTISSVSAESCRGAAKPALRDFMRA